ncbi:hypothetical protein CIB48_g11114 [Xylaria polymorpha]|nr:hypothetical protein CIB48_g11114 [Xylaria polymorpha]
MDSLPPELLARVVSFLPCTTDLISMRLVNRVNAAIAFRPLFELLRFSGRRQDQTPPWNFGPSIERELSKGQVGRTRTIEFGKLPEVVDEILGSSLARYTKTFVFDPAYYRERFWQDYLLQLENEMYEPVDEVEFGSDDDLDGDWDDAIERVLHHRRTRPEREAETINAAQATWNEKIEEQKQNEEAVVVALTKLFQSMAGLEKIEIKPWVFNGCLFYPGLESCIPAIRHVFTGLQEIRLDVLDVEFLADEAKRLQVIVELFKCCQPTLRKLSFVAGGKWPSLPARGAHSLLKMLSDEADETPLVFPRLEFVRLGGLILSTPPLLRFLGAQPDLKRLEFSHIYLSTPNCGWLSLVEGLPASIECWTVRGPLGHEPVEADGPPAYNWMTTWMPKELPSTSGWKPISREYGTYFERIR